MGETEIQEHDDTEEHRQLLHEVRHWYLSLNRLNLVYRRCHSTSKCSHGQKGCYYNSDCLSGLFCNLQAGERQGFCDDINECLPGKDQRGNTDVGIRYCGDTTGLTCVNTVRAFSCQCKSGCSTFSPYFGCTVSSSTSCPAGQSCR